MSRSAGFLYNGDGQFVARRANGITIAHYAAGSSLEKDPSSGAYKKYYQFGGKLVAEREVPVGGTSATVGTLHCLHRDHLGSTTLETMASGQYEGHQFRGPFGQPWASGGSLSTDLQYTGQRSYEGGAAPLGSLLGYGARSYSPVLGKFLQADTIVPGAGDPQSLNRFAYTKGNPLKYVDPTGHEEHGSPPDNATQRQKWDGSVWTGEWVWRDWGWTWIDWQMISGARCENCWPGDPYKPGVSREITHDDDASPPREEGPAMTPGEGGSSAPRSDQCQPPRCVVPLGAPSKYVNLAFDYEDTGDAYIVHARRVWFNGLNGCGQFSSDTFTCVENFQLTSYIEVVDDVPIQDLPKQPTRSVPHSGSVDDGYLVKNTLLVKKGSHSFVLAVVQTNERITSPAGPSNIKPKLTALGVVFFPSGVTEIYKEGI